MLNLILFGPPGSGKGTQAAILKNKYQLIHISTGDLLREELAAGTTLGVEARKYMDQGLLVPDEVVIGMIASKLDEKGSAINGVIFDGFPRTVAQAAALDQLLEERNSCIASVLALTVGEEELVKRLVNRGLTSGRADDNEETVRKRIIEYNAKTKPVADYYRQFGKVAEVAGEGSINEINAALLAAIDAVG